MNTNGSRGLPFLDGDLEESLAALKNLSIVKLDYTAVDDAGLEFLQALPRVRQLSLDSTNISDGHPSFHPTEGDHMSHVIVTILVTDIPDDFIGKKLHAGEEY